MMKSCLSICYLVCPPVIYPRSRIVYYCEILDDTHYFGERLEKSEVMDRPTEGLSTNRTGRDIPRILNPALDCQLHRWHPAVCT